MRKEVKKSVCIRLNRAEFECLVELANEEGDTPTATAARLIVDGMSASQNDKTSEKQLNDLERKLTRTIFAMFSAVANYDEQARLDFKKRINEVLSTTGLKS
jgi:hypothetical protein